jgi:hypothetical protein
MIFLMIGLTALLLALAGIALGYTGAAAYFHVPAAVILFVKRARG